MRCAWRVHFIAFEEHTAETTFVFSGIANALFSSYVRLLYQG